MKRDIEETEFLCKQESAAAKLRFGPVGVTASHLYAL
jgi:hypothetical protein